ncbi:hypothetical protein SBY92_001158 [Candida maltosa Xu316]
MSSSHKPSFHKEGKSTIKVVNGKKSSRIPATQHSPFVEELVLTGRPNWKKAPPQLKQRYRGIFLVLLSIPIIGMSSFEIIRRLEGKSTKRVRQGERLPDGTNRNYSEEEKIKVEQESVMYKIFGKDFFLDGFTSKTRKSESEKKE